MMMAKAAPSAPVISHLRPLMTKPLPSGSARTLSRAGSEPAPPSGSVMAKQERTSPVARRLEILFALRGRGDDIEKVDVALVRCMKVQRDGAKDGVPGRLEDDGLLEVREALAAEVFRAVDAEQACGLGGGIQLAAQVLGNAVMPPSGVFFERNDLLANERTDAIAQLG